MLRASFGAVRRPAVVGGAAVQSRAVRGLATTAALKARIKTVSNIRKITKAMKMVAASKLRAVESQLAVSREMVKDVEEVWMEKDQATVNKQELLPGMEQLKDPSRHIIVPICSDRGLCGGINSGILKIVRKSVSEHEAAGHAVKLVTLGEKAKSGLERLCKGNFAAVITESGKQQAATFTEVSLLAEYILSQEYDTGDILYNKFKSAIAYIPQVAPILSLERAKFDRENWKNWELEGFQNEDEVLEALHEFRLAIRLQHMIVENATSEMSARMSAMDNSTKNAGEMLNKLKIMYNRQRQSKITTELIELISGASAAAEQTKKEE